MIRKITKRIHDGLSFYGQDLSEYCRYERKGYPFLDFNIKSDDRRVEDSIRTYNRFEQHEYIYQLEGDVYIEPKYGFVISKGKVVKPSIPYSYDAVFPDGSLLRLALHDYSKCHLGIIHKKAVISLRDIYDVNYFHFFNDVLPKLSLLGERGFDVNLPIVISKSLYGKAFFQGFLKRNGFLNNELIVQDDKTFINAERVFSCKAMPHTRIYYDEILDRLRVSPRPGRGKKIFVIRKTGCSNGRFLINLDEISALCRRYGFDIVDPGALSLDRQIDLFSGCRYLIGIHGGGMTNMIFRRDNEMSILEMFPPDTIPPHYYWLSRLFGHGYDSIVGEKAGKMSRGLKDSFIIDPDRLEEKIKSLLY